MKFVVNKCVLQCVWIIEFYEYLMPSEK